MSNDNAQKFLDMMIQLIDSNPSLVITDKLVYAQLISFRLGNGRVPFTNVEKYFRNWITNFQNNPIIDVYRDRTNPFICHFSSKREANTNIKIYVPLDDGHIKDGVLDLFSFITRENIIHDSKVLSSVRNDNIIIRVSKIEDANKIIKYIKNNNYLSDGLLNANPFLIPCFKVGITVDNNYTYNVEITKALSSLLEELKEKNEFKKCNLLYLRKFFSKLSVKCADDELSDIYKLASIALDTDSTLQDFANYVLEYRQSSYTNKHGIKEISYNSSVDYFNTAVLETFKRYNNLSFVINAVKLYIASENVKGFTRINHARKNLMLYADRDQLKTLFDFENLDLSIKYYLLKVITEG